MTSADSGTKRTRADIAAETREAILAAACEVIAEIGFEKIRMRMVAERAGVSTAALHYHFDTRENLFAEALRYSSTTPAPTSTSSTATPTPRPRGWPGSSRPRSR